MCLVPICSVDRPAGELRKSGMMEEPTSGSNTQVDPYSHTMQASGIILGIPEFRKDFGYFFDGNYVLPANWQSAFSGAPSAAQIIGALFTGQIADSIGRRYTLVIALAISFAAVCYSKCSFPGLLVTLANAFFAAA